MIGVWSSDVEYVNGMSESDKSDLLPCFLKKQRETQKRTESIFIVGPVFRQRLVTVILVVAVVVVVARLAIVIVVVIAVIVRNRLVRCRGTVGLSLVRLRLILICIRIVSWCWLLIARNMQAAKVCVH
jgi:hypothetical protein